MFMYLHCYAFGAYAHTINTQLYGLDYCAWTVSIYVERWSFLRFVPALEFSFSLFDKYQTYAYFTLSSKSIYVHTLVTKN